MRLALACLILPALMAPALGDDSPITGTWIDDVTRGGPGAPATYGTETEFKLIRTGKLQIWLEVTPMEQVAADLGGNVHRWGEAGGAVAWLCYTQGAQTLWYYSDGEMGDGNVTGIGLDARDSPPASAGCTDFPGDTMDVDFHAPTIGARAKAIADIHGKSPSDANGWFRYWSIEPVPDEEFLQVWQEVTYRQKDGVIDAFAILQETGD